MTDAHRAKEDKVSSKSPPRLLLETFCVIGLLAEAGLLPVEQTKPKEPEKSKFFRGARVRK